MKTKLNPLLLVVLLTGCVAENSRVYLRPTSQTEDTGPAKGLWQPNLGRCTEKSTEIMTLEDIREIANAWNSNADLSKQIGFEPPKVLSLASTRYPDVMLSQGINGSVFLLIQIDRKGKVAEAHAVCASHSEFIPNAIEALKKYRYEPAKIKGVAVKSTAFQPIRFIAP